MDQAALISILHVPQREVVCSRCNLREICLPVGLTRDELESIDGRMVTARRKLTRGEQLFQVGDRFEHGVRHLDRLLQDLRVVEGRA